MFLSSLQRAKGATSKTQRLRFGAKAMGFVAFLAAVACSPTVHQAGGLELLVATNLAIPADFDSIHLRIAQQEEDGGFRPPVLDADYPMMAQSDLPTRFAIAAGKDPDQVALIAVTATLGGRAIVTEQVQIQVPTDRVAEYVLTLSAKCVGVICLEGNTCDPDTGMCVSNVVDPGQLPPYTPGEPIDAGPVADVATPAVDGGEGGGPPPGDSGPVADADAQTEAGMTCVPGKSCTPADCQTGQYVCTSGGTRRCMPTGNVGDGTPCGSGSGNVCHQGACVACAANADCTPADSCQKMQYDCSTGVAVCAPAGNEANGMSCGMNLYCNDGMCEACTDNADCQPPPPANPCNAGKIVCSMGQASCQDQGTPAMDGTSCGMNMVCHQGSCKACTANVSCTPTANVCDKGVTDCSTGVQTCKDQGAPDPAQNGQTCATGSVCDNGACNACPQSQDCRPAGTCQVMVDVCSSGAPVCTPGTGNVPDGTSCGGANACCGGSCVDTQTDSNNCGSCGNACTSPAGAVCAGGQCGCAAGAQSCSGKCVDVMGSDANNCGACGHSCMGGACSTGQCQPWVIAQPPVTNTVYQIATDGTNVVWIDNGNLLEIAATGGAVTTLDSGGVASKSLSLHGGRAMYEGPEHGGASLVLATLGSAASGTYVSGWFGTWAALNPSGTRYIVNTTFGIKGETAQDCAIGGSCVGSTIQSMMPTADSTNPVVDTAYAFVTLGTQILRETVGVGGTWSVFENMTTNNLTQLAVDGTYVYWNAVTMITGPNQVIGNVYRTPEANPGTPQLVSTGVSVFATDGVSAYFPNGTATSMQSVPVGGGASTPLAPISGGCAQIAVAGKLLVWLSGTTTIYGLALR